MYRENLDEIEKRYNALRTPPPPLFPPPPLPPPPPSTPPPRFRPELSSHPRWRSRNVTSDSRTRSMDVPKFDHPPIEALQTCSPSSAETVSTSPRRRTPTEPRSLRLRVGNNLHGNRTQPYFTPQQQRGRRRAPPGQTNGRGRRGRGQGRSVNGRGDVPNGNPSPPDSSAGDASAHRTLVCDDEVVVEDYHRVLDDGF